MRDERIWNRVESRTPPPSECNLVRQKHARNPCLRIVEDGDINHNKCATFGPSTSLWHLKEFKSWSFFFTNLAENYSFGLLKEKFVELGEVLDLFCPKKRDKCGNILALCATRFTWIREGSCWTSTTYGLVHTKLELSSQSSIEMFFVDTNPIPKTKPISCSGMCAHDVSYPNMVSKLLWNNLPRSIWGVI